MLIKAFYLLIAILVSTGIHRDIRQEEPAGKPEIRFYDNTGVPDMVEKYFNITHGCKVPASTFVPPEFNNARW